MTRRLVQRMTQSRAIQVGVLIAALGLIVAQPAHALSLSEFLTQLLWEMLIWPFAQLLNMMVYVLITVAQYNGFATEPIVIKGWTLMRNTANMFFVFVLLIIAIGTIVKWPVMNYRQNLRKLILMALLINFSRTITVFIIDLSQVMVLTFLSAVQDALQGGVITLLGIDDVISNVGSQSAAGGAAVGVITFLLAAVMVLIAAIVVGVIVIIFIARIIALWVLIIMAPMVFLMSVIPQTEKYYRQWWDMLGKNAASGPILAFFLWLTFAVVADQGNITNDPALSGTIASIGGVTGTTILNFIIGIGMLVYSIRLASSVAGAGGALASKFGNMGLGGMKSLGKVAGVGRSGQGGALGLARSGLAAATRPIESGRKLATWTANKVPIVNRVGFKGEGADRRLGWVGTKGALGQTGGEAFSREGLRGIGRGIKAAGAGAREKGVMGTTGAVLGSTIAGGASIIRETTTGAAKAAVRGSARLVRRVQATAEGGERERKQARVQAAAKKIGTEDMDRNQLLDVIDKYVGVYNSDQAAAAVAMMKDPKKMDELKKITEEKDENGSRTAKAVHAQEQYDKIGRLWQTSAGLTKAEIDQVKEKNLRHSGMTDDQLREKLRTMFLDGKSLAAGDLQDARIVNVGTQVAGATLSSGEFKKWIDKIPKDRKGDAARGLEENLAKLYEQRTSITDRDQLLEHNAKIDDAHLGLAKLAPNDIEIYAHDVDLDANGKVERENGRVKFRGAINTPDGKRTVQTRDDGTVDKTAEEERRHNSLAKGLTVKEMSAMKLDVLRSNAHRMSASDLIKTDGNDDVSGAQSQALIEGLVMNIDLNSTTQKETFKTVLQNPLVGGKLRAHMVETFQAASVPEPTPEQQQRASKIEAIASQILEGMKKGQETLDALRPYRTPGAAAPQPAPTPQTPNEDNEEGEDDEVRRAPGE